MQNISHTCGGSLWAETQGAETQNLFIRNAEVADAAAIGDVYRSCGCIAEWTGMEHDEKSLEALLANTDLPPGGSAEFNHMVVILEKKTMEIAGICQYYTAWPEAGCMWIGLMLVHPKHQSRHFGSEFLTAFQNECARRRYRQIGLGVAVRNVPALKFWVKSGFDQIVKVKANGECGKGSLAMLSLRMPL